VGSEEGAFESVELEAVFYQSYAMLRSAIKQSGAAVTHDPLPIERGNEVQLRQLLQNLIGNAIKYRSATRPEIHLSAEEDANFWTVRISDNGIGIPADYQQRVFDAFTRLHPQDAIPGTGIGLAFCRRIVEHHGGRIWVDSQPGQGSVFSFTLHKHDGGRRKSKD
jgi:signal transduction histidine kinase